MNSPPQRVVVIGCGGIGSWFINGVVRALEYGAAGSMLVIVDGDTFEEKNLERQTFSQLGSKAQIMRVDLAAKFPETIIIAKHSWVVAEGEQSDEQDEDKTTKIAPSQLLQEGDHVFVLVDNYATRALLFNAAESFDNIDVYSGGNGDDLTGYVYHYCRRDGADITMHPGKMHDEFVNPPDKNPGALSCEERAKIDGGTQILAANLGVAAMLLAKVSYFVLGTPEQAAASVDVTEVQFDLALGLSSPYEFREVGKTVPGRVESTV